MVASAPEPSLDGSSVTDEADRRMTSLADISLEADHHRLGLTSQ